MGEGIFGSWVTRRNRRKNREYWKMKFGEVTVHANVSVKTSRMKGWNSMKDYTCGRVKVQELWSQETNRIILMDDLKNDNSNSISNGNKAEVRMLMDEGEWSEFRNNCDKSKRVWYFLMVWASTLFVFNKREKAMVKKWQWASRKMSNWPRAQESDGFGRDYEDTERLCVLGIVKAG